ncbi:MAG: LysM peptidoglycan-binding domain-containing protein [Planctomycetes bacterium]|nr:LysM peptidoglycan-binding domain-containing protein [Planctomycetota bacterium]
MNSLRPLLTITILAVVGAYLYVKINEAPVRPVARLLEDPRQTPEGVPPLNATDANEPAMETAAETASLAPAMEGSAPPWTGTLGAAAPSAETEPTTLPTVPAIPELPDVSSPSDTEAPTTISVPTTPETQLPTSIPVARYPGESAATESTDSSVATGSAAASVDVQPASVPVGGISATSDATATPAAQEGHSEIPAATAITPPTAGATSVPVGPSFAASWPAIEAALARNELAQAHQLLSQWYGEPSLSPTEKQQVNSLLSQLAGTVVYSTEHRLEPAHVVQPGETLETIAAKYDVPWQLLAKINGIAAANALQPGQPLKVIRGPFSAVVELGKSELTLILDGRYAGAFPIIIPAGATVSEGQWLVDQKMVMPSSIAVQSAYAPAPAAAEQAIVLRSDGATLGTFAASGATLVITGGTSPIGAAASTPAIRLSPQDVAELSDILSIGSRVVIRR